MSRSVASLPLSLVMLLTACGPSAEHDAPARRAPGVESPEATSPSAPTGDTAAVTAVDTPDCRPALSGCVARHAAFQSEGDFITSSLTEVRHDPCGQPLAIDITTDLPGSQVRTLTLLTYDAQHRPTLERRTFPSSTVVPDEVTEHHHDALGHLVLSEYDYDDDGIVDATTEYTYDTLGRRVLERFTYGEVLDATRYVHEGDDDVGSVATDEGDDGTIDRIESWDRGRQITWLDADGDGIDEEQTTVTLNDRELPVESVTIDPGDGTVLSHVRSSYDAEGRRVLELVDEGDDGILEAETRTHWTCH